MRRTTRIGLGTLMVCAFAGALTYADAARYSFGDPIDTPFAGTPTGSGTADVNRDGVQDLAVLAYDFGESGIEMLLQVRRTDGFGGFEAVDAYPLATSAAATRILGVPDAGGGGDRLLLVGSRLQLVTLENDGSATIEHLITAGGIAPAGAVVADVNDDQRPDILAVQPGGTDPKVLRIWLQAADGSFAETEAIEYREPGNVLEHLAAGDFDGDRKVDLLVYPTSQFVPGPAALVLYGNDDATFTTGTDSPALVGLQPRLVVGDVNGDGRTDVMDGPNLYVANADRTFTAHSDVTTADESTALSLIDVDDDQRLDLVTATEIFCGAGDGTFADPAPAPGLADPENRMITHAVVDLTGDDLPDVFAYAPQDPGTSHAVIPQTGEPPPSVLSTLPELTQAGVQAFRLTGTGFHRDVQVVSIGDLVVRSVVRESDTSIVMAIDVPPGIGTDPQSLMVRNPDSRSQQIDFAVRGLHVRSTSGKIVDKLAPSRDRVKLTADIEFTELSALGDQVDVRDGLRLEFGDPEDPYVLDVPATPENWKLRGLQIPGKFVYKSGRGEFPRLKVVVDTAKGKLRLGAKALELPGDPDGLVLLRVRLAGESAELADTFEVKDKRNGTRRLSRRR